MDYLDLLEEFNLVDHTINITYPGNIRMNPKDMEKHRKSLIDKHSKRLKKSKKHIDRVLAWDYLNFAPATDESVPEGQILITEIEP